MTTGQSARCVIAGIWTWRTLIGLLVIAFFAGAARSQEPAPLECGANALFILFRLENRPVTLDRLESALPPRNAKGYSMAELAVAARSLGLELEGVSFVKGDKALTRPAIAYVKGPMGGHYAVIRPVGTTGKMVQVIDAPRVPWIADYDRVLSSESWTGRILVPREPWIARNAGRIAAGAAGLALLLTSVGLTLRKMRSASRR